MAEVAEEDLNLIRQAYDAWNRGDREWLVESVSPEFEMHDLETPDAPVFRGREGVLENIARMDELFSEFRLRIDDLLPVDENRVLALIHVSLTGRGSGVELEQDIGHIWTVRDHILLRCEIYLDPMRARAAAGLDG